MVVIYCKCLLQVSVLRNFYCHSPSVSGLPAVDLNHGHFNLYSDSKLNTFCSMLRWFWCCTLFLWDIWSWPPVHVAKSLSCPVQMFRLKECCYVWSTPAWFRSLVCGKSQKVSFHRSVVHCPFPKEQGKAMRRIEWLNLSLRLTHRCGYPSRLSFLSPLQSILGWGYL